MDDKRLKAHQLLNTFVLTNTSDKEMAKTAFDNLITHMLENFDGPSTDPVVFAQQKKDIAKIIDADPKLTGPQLLRIMRINPTVMDDVVWAAAALRLTVGIIGIPPGAAASRPFITWALRFGDVML